MKNHSKLQPQIIKEVEKAHKEIQPALYEFSKTQEESYDEAEKEMNAKILKITTQIREQYPELSPFMEEMPVTIPDKENPEIVFKNLKAYYDSINSILSKYILEHPSKKK